MAINLKEPNDTLFSDVAEYYAQRIADAGQQRKNRSTQLRGFYDEILNWESRSRVMSDQQFKESIPLIKMLIAKVTYAKGRDYVTQEYVELMRECITQVSDRASLRNCKLFFEAFMGFYKVYGPK
ncbi:type III-A CRISPR-associated protein Csm2 [Acinetobacter modestus]|uniref:type III-A CRISPR-associated protein Csm2 n=1 Tax=Acinetobacter modestus TaxID=1776740 RepID=UPI00202FE2FD|nr:type III-A CRISPR-associated protein Csm2 [Acinetobacter modestus]MCM1960678.1 type III-A CRISPR-associated protein Csm2 [Acinetobacter modestus]